MNMPPRIMEPGSLNRQKSVNIAEVLQWPVDLSRACIEVAHEEKRVVLPRLSYRHNTAKKFPHSGPWARRRVDHPKREVMIGNADFQPQPRIFQQRNPGIPSREPRLRKHANRVIETSPHALNLMPEALVPQRPRQLSAGARDKLNERDHIGIMRTNALRDAVAARSASLPDIPAQELHLSSTSPSDTSPETAHR